MDTKFRGVLFMANYGTDPTEAAVPWHYLRDLKGGVDFDIATEHGAVPDADNREVSLQALLRAISRPHRMYKGLFSKVAGADKAAKTAYAKLAASPECQKPKSFSDASFDIMQYDLVILPGGHDKGVKQLYESKSLHEHLKRFFPSTRGPESKKVLAAICHGPLALAFAKDEQGRSLLHDRKLTCLPEAMEQAAYTMTRLFFGDYYITYEGTRCARQVAEVAGTYEVGPPNRSLSRAPEAAFVVEDERFITARWPGDAFLWSETIWKVLQSTRAS